VRRALAAVGTQPSSSILPARPRLHRGRPVDRSSLSAHRSHFARDPLLRRPGASSYRLCQCAAAGLAPYCPLRSHQSTALGCHRLLTHKQCADPVGECDVGTRGGARESSADVESLWTERDPLDAGSSSATNACAAVRSTPGLPGTVRWDGLPEQHSSACQPLHAANERRGR
jgi:hypothetical protein